MNDRITELRALVSTGFCFTRPEVDALLDCAEALTELILYARDSQGIAGYHMNGAILEWDDVEELHAGMNALARLNGDDHATSEPVGESNDG